VTEHPILVLGPEAIEASPHRGTMVHQTWGELVAYVRRPLWRERKDSEGGVALGSFRDGVRRLSHFEHTTLLGLDLDEGKLSASAFFELIGPWCRLVYPTHSSTSVHPKNRAILVLDRALDGPEHKRVMRVMYAHLARVGVQLDPAAKDATRWWFCPLVHPDRVAHYAVHATDETAPAIPVDRFLAQADELDADHAAEVEARRRANPPPLPASAERHAVYVRGAIARAVEHIARAPEGERHAALNSEAWSLARLGLSTAEIGDALIPAFVVAAGQSREAEAVRTVRDACQARGST
jgi:hypothetical protein